MDKQLDEELRITSPGPANRKTTRWRHVLRFLPFLRNKVKGHGAPPRAARVRRAVAVRELGACAANCKQGAPTSLTACRNADAAIDAGSARHGSCSTSVGSWARCGIQLADRRRESEERAS
jgi:hypothetical protein